MTRLISGYASLFGKPDLGGDEVLPGAFADSLKGRPPRDIKMLYQHDSTRPIGRWQQIYETDKGLWVEGQLTAHVQLADEVVALVGDGALDGLSIGYRTRRAVPGQGAVKRQLIDLHLVEISLVTFPMQPEARLHLKPNPSTELEQLRCAGAQLRRLSR